MDRILEAMMVSHHPISVKHCLVRRMLEAAKQPLDSGQCCAMFELSIKLILLGDTKFKRDVGKEVLRAFAENHGAEFEKFFNVSFILKLLQDGYGTLSRRNIGVLECIQLGLKYIEDSDSAYRVFQALQIELLRIVCERPGPKLCATLCKLLSEFPQSIPSGKLQVVFCQQLVRSIGQFQCRSNGEDEIVEYLEQVTRISRLLQKIWTIQAAVIIPSLRELFIVISTTEGSDGPSNALAAVVQYVPLEFLDGVIRNLTNDDSITDAELMTALENMIDWLSWPLAQNIDKWIVGLLKGLAAVKKFAILIDVTLSRIQQVFSRLFYPVTRPAGLVVLKYMLLNFQHSPEAFHLLVPHLPKLVVSLSKEESASGTSCLKELTELVHCMIFRFSGFPDLYERIVETLKDFPIPNEEKIKQLLEQNTWTTEKNTSVLFHPSSSEKSITGRTGLVNLGNTCYMNSVIQALYMAYDFRRAVILLKEIDSQPIMLKLQWLFVFLEHSKRPAISPDSFLKVSSPPWFNPGTQQDCSEYLKHLLDRSHEEEKRVIFHKLKCSGSEICMEDDQDSEKTLIERMFGGKMVTRIYCLCCRNVSFREEAFTDLSLAFPPLDRVLHRFGSSNDPAISVEIVGSDNSISHLKPQKATKSGGKPKQTKSRDSFVRVMPIEIIGSNGKAKKEEPSDSKETKRDNLYPYSTIPKKIEFAMASGEKACGSSSSRSVSDLINYFLSPERLTGDNRYYCEKCTSLQDAEKVVELTRGPHYLILTLLRFSFDLVAMKRKKILDNVSLPLVLKLPIRVTAKKDKQIVDADTPGHHIKKLRHFADNVTYLSLTYDLCCIVVHSGNSSDSGHYYCYARDCVEAESGMGPEVNLENERRSENQWYLYNDTRVSFSSFESVSNVTNHFPKDTAYVLFYRQRAGKHTCLGNESVLDNVKVHRETPKHTEEQEMEARRTSTTSITTPVQWRRFDDDQDDGPSGSCGPAAGGGSDFGSFEHLVF
ncbi:ubiquitin carboxyl-terminal hydrolase 35 isoform X2 [Callorhinchus milii]|uniref:ubiquitin carboxyl-terminal hydrolase 35 isoform X2 n=1 Tax=Callorhinchus milii TaxID=7868 RepID=UPI001C3FAE01|nr:ubiquitin carboxyl-terminal hydrolase 35 isoform X2 [Callorhinchus milii]